MHFLNVQIYKNFLKNRISSVLKFLNILSVRCGAWQLFASAVDFIMVISFGYELEVTENKYKFTPCVQRKISIFTA